jgi:hypothetical protein
MDQFYFFKKILYVQNFIFLVFFFFNSNSLRFVNIQCFWYLLLVLICIDDIALDKQIKYGTSMISTI